MNLRFLLMRTVAGAGAAMVAAGRARRGGRAREGPDVAEDNGATRPRAAIAMQEEERTVCLRAGKGHLRMDTRGERRTWGGRADGGSCE